MSRLSTLLLLLLPALALAEGSDETNQNGAANATAQILDAQRDSDGDDIDDTLFTTVYVDILDASESIVFTEMSGEVEVFDPDGNSLGTFSENDSLDATAGTGAYRLEFGQDQVDWDVEVSPAPPEGFGRVWSRAWHFDAQTFGAGDGGDDTGCYTCRDRTQGEGGCGGCDGRTFASFYALVDGGGPNNDAVVEMKTAGLAGFIYLIAANDFGIQGANGRSVLQAEAGTVIVDHPIYLLPPEKASYNALDPALDTSDAFFEYDGTCAVDGVAADTASGDFVITSNVDGNYHVVCDLNGDLEFDHTSDDDVHLLGTIDAGQTLRVPWDGVDNGGDPVPEGTYECEIWLTVGEFHYVGGDMETSYRGLRLFEVEGDLDRVGRPMFWNDEAVHGCGVDDDFCRAVTMPNGLVGLETSGAAGVDSGTWPTSTCPRLEPDGTEPVTDSTWATAPSDCPIPASENLPSELVGNARAWGNFDRNPDNGTPDDPSDDNSKGNVAWLDTYTWVKASARQPATVTVLSVDDSDGDSLSDADEECFHGTDPDLQDTDGDGLDDDVEVLDVDCDPTDADSDGDGLEDGDEVAGDSDGDGADDCVDPDDDGDGIPTLDEDLDEDGDYDDDDSDNDGTPDYLDPDDDGDGIDTEIEGDGDTDDDGIPDYLDEDSDGDGLLDEDEGTGDTDDDGNPDFQDPDDDGDGIPTEEETGEGDTDDDGTPDYLDPDDDGDGIPTIEEGDFDDDFDDDGTPNHQDLDSDGDGIGDETEGTDDVDDDGAPNFLDLDSDGDGYPDEDEGTTDSDGDGDGDWIDPDDDDDTVPSAEERPGDTDGDGLDDRVDPDDDGDGIDTATEAADGAEHGDDVDDDGDPNWVDTDADGDGLPDEEEGTADTDGDGVPDYLDPDGAYSSYYEGSCIASTSGGPPASLPAWLLAGLAGVLFARRREGAPVLAGALLALGLLGLAAPAQAGDAPEISRSEGRASQLIVLWPRVIPATTDPGIHALASDLQQRLVSLSGEVAPDRPANVRPEPERVCPEGRGCKAPRFGALLLHKEGGCAVVALMGAAGKSPERLVPWAADVDLDAREIDFRNRPEEHVTVQDFVPCDELGEHLQGEAARPVREALGEIAAQ